MPKTPKTTRKILKKRRDRLLLQQQPRRRMGRSLLAVGLLAARCEGLQHTHLDTHSFILNRCLPCL